MCLLAFQPYPPSVSRAQCAMSNMMHQGGEANIICQHLGSCNFEEKSGHHPWEDYLAKPCYKTKYEVQNSFGKKKRKSKKKSSEYFLKMVKFWNKNHYFFAHCLKQVAMKEKDFNKFLLSYMVYGQKMAKSREHGNYITKLRILKNAVFGDMQKTMYWNLANWYMFFLHFWWLKTFKSLFFL